jgi:transcriptional regulator with XRE-family HTH domain
MARKRSRPPRPKAKPKSAPERAERDPSLVALSTRIRELRTAAKITQEEFAVRSGISVAFASMLERAARSASIETLAKVARALDVPLAELFRTDKEMRYDDPYFDRLVGFARAARLNRRDVEHLIDVGCVVFKIPRDQVPQPAETTKREAVAPCSIEGCGRPALAKGLCASHYHQQRREERS